MSRTVWKYPLDVADVQTVTMPFGARVLTVQAQDGVPMLWALVDPDKPYRMTRQFLILGTGHPADDRIDTDAYVGTFQLLSGGLVFHVFEVTR